MKLDIIVNNAQCQLINRTPEIDAILNRGLSYKDQNIAFTVNKAERKIKDLELRLAGRGGFSIDIGYLQKELTKQKKIYNFNIKKLFVKLYHKGVFPTGLLPRAVRLLDGHEVNIIDKRIRPKLKQHRFVLKESFPPLRYYQKEAAQALEKLGRGVFVSATGCHAKGTEILMYDGSIKKVEKVIVGDKLMGPDSKPRTVLRLARGRERMVKISPIKGEPFVVNMNHILNLQSTYGNKKIKNRKTGKEFVNISVRDYINSTKNFKHLYKLRRVGVEFNNTYELPIDPYVLGIWLGDGSSGQPAVTSMDQPVIDAWYEWAKSLGLSVNVQELSDNKSKTYGIVNGGNRNPARALLSSINLLNNKHIPSSYLTASRFDRLSLLAGILDADGYYSTGSFDYISKRKELANGVVFLARSLGLAAYVRPCVKSSQNGTKGIYYRVSISGDVNIIPNRVARRRARKRVQKKSVLKTGFKYELLPEDDFYGFALDGDHLYLTSDFTVHHNTGKTVTLCKMIWDLGVNTLVITPSKAITDMMLDTMIRHFGKGKVEKLTTKTKVIKKPIAIVNIQALIKLKPEILKGIDAMFTDEFHHSGASTFREANLKHLKDVYFRIGATATNFRAGGDSMALEAVLSEVLYEFPSKRAIKEGFLVPPEFIIQETKSLEENTYRKSYEENIVNSENRNNLIAEIANAHTDDHVLILVKEIAHGEKLKELLPNASFINGLEKDVVRNRMLDDFRSGKLKCLIGTNGVIGEGVDLPIADVLIMGASGKSQIQTVQNVGRVLRPYPGKTKALVYDFTDLGCKWLAEHARLRMLTYEEYFL